MLFNRTFYLIIILFMTVILATGCNDESESLEKLQERAVASQQIENPYFSTPPMNEIEVDDEELIRFVNLGVSLGRIQAEARQQMMEVLNDNELSVDDYSSIRHAKSMGFSLDDYNFSDEALEKFEVVAKLIDEIEQDVDSRFESSIADAGFSQERFLDLNIAMQHNMELMERSKELLMKQSEE